MSEGELEDVADGNSKEEKAERLAKQLHEVTEVFIVVDDKERIPELAGAATFSPRGVHYGAAVYDVTHIADLYPSDEFQDRYHSMEIITREYGPTPDLAVEKAREFIRKNYPDAEELGTSIWWS